VLDLRLGVTEVLKARHRKQARENCLDALAARGLACECVAIANSNLAALNATFDTIVKERRL
jgi:hypothetical protein